MIADERDRGGARGRQPRARCERSSTLGASAARGGAVALAARRRRPASATRAGRPTGASARRTRTRTTTAATASTSSSTGSSRTTWRCKERLRRAGQRVHLRDRRRGDRAPDRRRTTTATSPRRCAPPTRELEGHYAFVAMSLDEPDVLVGARKECPLVVGRGEGEQFVASAVPGVPRRRPGACSTSRTARSSCCAPDGVDDHRRRRREPSSAPVEDGRLGRGDRREGRLRDVHAEGDPRTGRRGRRDDRRPHRARRRRRPATRRARSTRRSSTASSGS